MASVYSPAATYTVAVGILLAACQMDVEAFAHVSYGCVCEPVRLTYTSCACTVSASRINAAMETRFTGSPCR